MVTMRRQELRMDELNFGVYIQIRLQCTLAGQLAGRAGQPVV